jgi:putative hydrolase of HD superfamily
MEAEPLLALLRRIEPLKHLLRTGWVDRGVSSPETVAAHSWRLAIMAWLTASEMGLDGTRAIRLALAHDMAESITGDRTPFDELGATAAERRALAIDPPDREQWRSDLQREAKAGLERQAMQRLLDGAPASAATAIRAAWEEYEAGNTAEARLVRQLDKLEAFLQGCEYASDGRLPDISTLNSFRVDLRVLVSDPLLRSLLQALEAWDEHMMALEAERPTREPLPERQG